LTSMWFRGYPNWPACGSGGWKHQSCICFTEMQSCFLKNSDWLEPRNPISKKNGIVDLHCDWPTILSIGKGVPKFSRNSQIAYLFLIKHDTADHLFLDCFLFFSTTNWDYPSFADDSPL
jgi:hypothetical protein